MVKHVLGVLAIGISSAGAVLGQQSAIGPGPQRQAVARRATAAIHIDGRLDETDWLFAVPIGPFLQQVPQQGQPPTEDTEVRVLYDEDALYFGITCLDRTPAAVVSTQLTRDADLDVDDRLTIVLDPFFDHRNGFFFQVNPAGARTDGQIASNAERLTRDWDGIWSAAAQRTGQGWVVEIAVPFKTLRFKPGQPVWGLNIERQIKRKQEIDRWTAADQNIWIGNLAEAGRLEDFSHVRQGLGLDVRPYAAGGDENGDGTADAGVDAFKSLTPDLNAAVTVNTDFAETEADLRQVNLTRFPLFFPEKRAFFLEGSGVFDAAGLSNSEDLRPFFSRRIGLVENVNGDNISVPIAAGAKLTGRQADYNIGLLEIATRTTHDATLPGGVLDGQNFVVLRASRNLFTQSWVGGILTHGNPTGAGSNTLVGADGHFATSTFHGNKNLTLDLFGFRTSDEAIGKKDGAGGFRVDYPNDLWDVSLNWKQIGNSFNAALGFVPRTGVRITTLGVAFQPRPDRWGIRQFFFEFEPEYITNLENRVENWRIFMAPFNTRTESGEHLEWNIIPEFEHLDAPFEISPGVIIPPGSYQWLRYRTEVNTATKRPWVVDASWWYGGFYDGTRREVAVGLTLKPNTHVSMAARVDRNDVALPQGSFYTQVLELNLDYNFTPNVAWANLVQYDNESRIAGIQSRFRWILRPGNDLFLVLNRGWHHELDGPFAPEFNHESVKLQYTFRF